MCSPRPTSPALRRKARCASPPASWVACEPFCTPTALCPRGRSERLRGSRRRVVRRGLPGSGVKSPGRSLEAAVANLRECVERPFEDTLWSRPLPAPVIARSTLGSSTHRGWPGVSGRDAVAPRNRGGWRQVGRRGRRVTLRDPSGQIAIVTMCGHPSSANLPYANLRQAHMEPRFTGLERSPLFSAGFCADKPARPGDHLGAPQ